METSKKSRTKKPEAALAADAPVDDQGESVAGIIDQIEGEAGDDGVEMMGMDAGSPKPAKATRQSPATRSSRKPRKSGRSRPRTRPFHQREQKFRRILRAVGECVYDGAAHILQRLAHGRQRRPGC